MIAGQIGRISTGFIKTYFNEGTVAEDQTLDYFSEQPFPNTESAQHAMIQAFLKFTIRKREVEVQMGFILYWCSSVFPVNFQALKGLANY